MWGEISLLRELSLSKEISLCRVFHVEKFRCVEYTTFNQLISDKYLCEEILLCREFFEEIFHCEKLYIESCNEKRFIVQKVMCRVFSTLYTIFKQLIGGKDKDYATFLPTI